MRMKRDWKIEPKLDIVSYRAWFIRSAKISTSRIIQGRSVTHRGYLKAFLWQRQ